MPRPKKERPSHSLPVQTRAGSHRLAATGGKVPDSKPNPPTYLQYAPSVYHAAPTESGGRRTRSISRAASARSLRYRDLAHPRAPLASRCRAFPVLHNCVQAHGNCRARNRNIHKARPRAPRTSSKGGYAARSKSRNKRSRTWRTVGRKQVRSRPRRRGQSPPGKSTCASRGPSHTRT